MRKAEIADQAMTDAFALQERQRRVRLLVLESLDEFEAAKLDGGETVIGPDEADVSLLREDGSGVLHLGVLKIVPPEAESALGRGCDCVLRQTDQERDRRF